jgi:hypothetical protein
MRLFLKRLRNSLIDSISEKIRGKFGESISCLHDNWFSQADVTDKLLLIAGRQVSWQLRSCRNLNTFEDVEFRVFSQWGEDGIIEWILQNLPIEHKTFIEFGVENYREANTRFLIENRNWKGLVIDGSDANIQTLRSNKLYWMFDITAVTEFITRGNINRIISENGFAGELGILSIDIDGNDYWVMEAIDCVNPSVIICEYNPILGDKYPITIPYEPSFSRLVAHHSGLYFGASIAAIKLLAKRKGYEFLGTNSNGINAFFVRKDLFPHLEPLIANRKAYPSKHRDSRAQDGSLTYVSGLGRYDLIKHLQVIRVDTGENVIFESLGIPYSQEWLSGMSIHHSFLGR